MKTTAFLPNALSIEDDHSEFCSLQDHLSAFLVETVELARLPPECLLPAVQRPPRDIERFSCRSISVLLPEDEYFESLLRLLLIMHTSQS